MISWLRCPIIIWWVIQPYKRSSDKSVVRANPKAEEVCGRCSRFFWHRGACKP
jgi:hypothetical protein